MKHLSKLVILLTFISLISSCEKDDEPSVNTEEVTLSRTTEYGEDWIYFSFSTGAEVSGVDDSNYQINTTWDIAFNRYNVRTNGGASGSGEATVFDAGELNFDAVTEAPETGYTPDSSIQIVESLATTPPTMMASNGNILFVGAIEFSGPPPAYAPNNHIYIVKTANGKYAKIKITGFYNDLGDSGYLNFKYTYQSNGSRFFE
jgi:hypothetical protein